MNANEAKKLRVGDRVAWQENTKDLGTITEIGYCAVKIQWDNGQLGVLHTSDCNGVSRA